MFYPLKLFSILLQDFAVNYYKKQIKLKLMIKDILNFGKILDKKEQTKINGGIQAAGPRFIGSSCYSQRRFCNAALTAAISRGADPSKTSCVPCSRGWEVRIFGTINEH